MLHPADNPEVLKDLWHLASRIRERGQIVDRLSAEVLEVFAALILLRHAGGIVPEDSESPLSWHYIRTLAPSEYSRYLESTLRAYVQANPSERLDFLTLILKDETLQKVSPDLFVFARDRIDSYDFSLSQDRRNLARELDCYIEFWSQNSPQLGQFLTPPEVIAFTASLANPKPGQSIYDPFCGMGGFLAQTAKIVSEQQSEVALHGASEILHLHGADLLPGLCLIACARVVLYESTDPHFYVGDSLSENAASVHDANCIISNPPFGGRISQPRQGALGMRSRSMDELSVQQILASLAPGGRAFIVVPQGMLFASSTTQLRKFLLSNFTVEAVIAIPKGVFSRYTSIKTNLLIVSKREPKQTVLFVAEQFVNRIFGDLSTKSRRVAALTALLEARLDHAQSVTRLREIVISAATELRLIQNSDNDERRDSLTLELLDLTQLLELIAEADPLSIETLKSASSALFATKHGDNVAWEMSIEEIASRAYELLVKPQAESDLRQFLDDITSVLPSSQVVTLSDVAEIFPGVHYKREFVSDGPASAESIPLVRVQDVTLASKKSHSLPELAKPQKLLLPLGATSIGHRYRLRDRDIVLTASGTVGAVGIVGESSSGAVPSNGIIVIRTKPHIDPLYVVKLLQSVPYQEWFKGHSSGSTIQHLSVNRLRGLPLILLPMEMTLRITHFLKGGEDAPTILNVFRDSSPSESLSMLNERLLRELTRPMDFRSPESERWWHYLSQWVQETALVSREDRFDPYLDQVLTMAKDLLEAKAIQNPEQRYSVFRSWRNKLVHSLHVSEGDSAKYGAQLSLWSSLFRQYASQLTKWFAEASAAQTIRLLSDISLDASVSPSVIPLGTLSDIHISISNKGALPLKNVRFETSPILSTSTVTSLNPGDSHSVDVRLAPTISERLSIHISWTAERIDGSSANGHLEVAIQANENAPQSFDTLFAQNPYVCGAPIDSSEQFYGRSDIIRRLRRSLRTSGPSTVIILEGNRRAGKTSLCKQLLLAEPDLLPGWIRAYWSMQAAPGHSSLPGLHTREIYYNIARELYLALHAAKVRVEIVGLNQSLDPACSRLEIRKQMDQLHGIFTDDNSFRLLDSQIDAMCAALGDKRLLLILDEFEKLQEGIDNGITSPQVPENIRDLFQRYNKLSGILTGSKRIKRLREEYWSVLYGIGIRINIGALDKDAAIDLIQKPSQGVLVFSPAATEKVMDLCACQPFLIQSLCHCIFEECATAEAQSVTTGTVDSAVSELLDENEHFAALWHYISNDRRRYLAYLVVTLSDGPDVITSSLLAQKLESDGIDPSSLDGDIAELRELDILGMREFDQGNSYYVGLPLFALWIRKHKDFAICRSKALAE